MTPAAFHYPTAGTIYSAIMLAGGIERIFHVKKEFDVGLEPWTSDIKIPRVTVHSGMVYEKLVWGNFIHPPTVMIRRSVCIQAGKLDETIPTAEDWDYFLKISKLRPIAFIEAPLLDYRISDSQMSSPKNNADKIALNIIRVIEKLQIKDPDLYEKNEDSPPQAAEYLISNDFFYIRRKRRGIKPVLRNKKQFHSMLSLFHSNAAYALSKHHPMRSIFHLIKSFKYDFRTTKQNKTAISEFLSDKQI